MSMSKDDLPDDLDPKVKELLKRRDEDFDREFASLALVTCSTKCPKQNSHRMCINTVGHTGQHYCPNHGYFS